MFNVDGTVDNHSQVQLVAVNLTFLESLQTDCLPFPAYSYPIT